MEGYRGGWTLVRLRRRRRSRRSRSRSRRSGGMGGKFDWLASINSGNGVYLLGSSIRGGSHG